MWGENILRRFYLSQRETLRGKFSPPHPCASPAGGTVEKNRGGRGIKPKSRDLNPLRSLLFHTSMITGRIMGDRLVFLYR